MMFDLYDEVRANVKTITDDAFDKIDQSFADSLLYGLTSATYQVA